MTPFWIWGVSKWGILPHRLMFKTSTVELDMKKSCICHLLMTKQNEGKRVATTELSLQLACSEVLKNYTNT